MPARFREVVDSIIEAKDLTTLKRVMQEQPDSDFKNCITDNYNRYKQQISNALLWTAGISDTTHKDQFFFSNIVIYSQLSKGLTAQSISTLAVEAQSALNFTNDSLQTGRNLKRCFLDLQGGLQWVFRTKDYTPLLDCTLLAKYRHNFNGRYASEKINVWYISGKINVRIVNDIWIPLIIDYDPANRNLTAALQVKYNFTTLRSLFNHN